MKKNIANALLKDRNVSDGSKMSLNSAISCNLLLMRAYCYPDLTVMIMEVMGSGRGCNIL